MCVLSVAIQETSFTPCFFSPCFIFLELPTVLLYLIVSRKLSHVLPVFTVSPDLDERLGGRM